MRIIKWVKVFKNRPSKICGRQPLENLEWFGLPNLTTSNFLKTVFHKFYFVHSWVPWLKRAYWHTTFELRIRKLRNHFSNLRVISFKTRPNNAVFGLFLQFYNFTRLHDWRRVFNASQNICLTLGKCKFGFFCSSIPLLT